MLVGIFIFLGLSLLILGHEAGHFFVAKWLKLKIDEFGFGFPPRMFAWRPKHKHKETRELVSSETEYSFNWLPFGGFVKIAGENDQFDERAHETVSPEEEKRFFRAQSATRKVAVIGAGVLINFVVGWLLFAGVFMIGTPILITNVIPDSPAARAGIMPGDVIEGYADPKAFISFVNANQGKEIILRFLREGKSITIPATPRVLAQGERGALGIELGGIARESFFVALWEGLRESFAVAWATLRAFWELLVGIFTSGRLMEGIVGPVGIFSVANTAGKAGFVFLLHLLGLISVNLAVVNLIPFPALDGGRLLLIGIEKLKGSRLSRKVEIGMNAAGFVLLILLMVLITIRDIVRL